MTHKKSGDLDSTNSEQWSETAVL